MLMPAIGVLLVVGTFAWMGFMQAEESGTSWVREGARFFAWAMLVFGGLLIFVLALQGYGALD